MRVSIAGASGYAGGELLRLLEGHPTFHVIAAAAHSAAGSRIDSVHPSLAPTPIGSMVMCESTPANLQADIVFLALPHGQSALIALDLLSANPDQMIVDLGADFRLSDKVAWERYYGGKHAGTWEYGLPELANQRSLISQATRVANPGCYATAISLACAPAVAARLVGYSAISVVAASGTSGAGRVPSPTLIASSVMGAMSAYKIGGVHQHTPEIEQVLKKLSPEDTPCISFTPLLAPMTRGIIATCSIPISEIEGVNPIDLYRDYYKDSRFVSVLQEGQMPSTSNVVGSNYVQLSVNLDKHAGQLIVISTLDNLVKGAAGQAIQNANIMCEIEETSGLLQSGIAP